MCIGDLPVLVYDSTGRGRDIMIPNVRCVPTFTNTLLLVDELWKLSRFDGVSTLVFSHILQLRKTDSNGGVTFSLPFFKRRVACLYGTSQHNRQDLLRRPHRPCNHDRVLRLWRRH